MACSSSASSSSFSFSSKYCSTYCSKTSKKGLELALGLKSDTTTETVPPPTSQFQLKDRQGGKHQELELGLGLGLGLQLGSSSKTSSCSLPQRSPQPGLWFSLRSSINREGEVLPQVPKAFIRVKDENVTVFMVKTYLVRKLGLFNEAEVEISCMGKKLMPTVTLKHVRDAIWLPGLVEFLKSKADYSVESPQGTSVNYLMCLDYGPMCVTQPSINSP